MSEPSRLPSGVPVELHRQYRFQWEPAQESFVLLYPEGMVKLPGSAGEIMKRVDGTRSVEQIVKDLEAAFPGVDLRADVVEFLEVAYGKGWIRTKQAG
jgi:pyrroloquinoline quinone biosynthesis protein D